MEKNWHKWGQRKIQQLLTQEQPDEAQWTEILDYLCQGIDRRELPWLLAWLQSEAGQTIIDAHAQENKPIGARQAGERE